jgi:hypothetical protein
MLTGPHNKLEESKNCCLLETYCKKKAGLLTALKFPLNGVHSASKDFILSLDVDKHAQKP